METNTLMVMNHGDVGYRYDDMTRSISQCIRPDLTTPSIHHEVDDISIDVLGDSGGRSLENFIRDTHSNSRAHAHVHADGICEILVTLCVSVQLSLCLITKSCRRIGKWQYVPNLSIRYRWMFSSLSGRFMTGTNRMCLLNKGIFIFTLQAVWPQWWDGIFLPNKPQTSSTQSIRLVAELRVNVHACINRLQICMNV